TVRSPRIASSATFALNAPLCCRRCIVIVLCVLTALAFNLCSGPVFGVHYKSLREWLYALAPFGRWGDFQGDGEIALPEPYRILVEPSILYGYYRAWLRRYGAL